LAGDDRDLEHMPVVRGKRRAPFPRHLSFLLKNALNFVLPQKAVFKWWVRFAGGRKRRPTKGEEGEWDMPDYYRDDSVRTLVCEDPRPHAWSMCSRAGTIPSIEVPHRIGVPHRVTYPCCALSPTSLVLPLSHSICRLVALKLSLDLAYYRATRCQMADLTCRAMAGLI